MIRVTSIHQTAPLWPLKVPSLSPLLEYQTVGLLSLATENRRSPSRLYLEEVRHVNITYIDMQVLCIRSRQVWRGKLCEP